MNDHIKKEADKHGIPLIWWPSVGGGINGDKLEYVQKYHAIRYKGKGNFTYCILMYKENVQTFASRELTTATGIVYHQIYKVNKPARQYYIYFHDRELGGPCCLKISSYFSLQL